MCVRVSSYVQLLTRWIIVIQHLYQLLGVHIDVIIEMAKPPTKKFHSWLLQVTSLALLSMPVLVSFINCLVVLLPHVRAFAAENGHTMALTTVRIENIQTCKEWPATNLTGCFSVLVLLGAFYSRLCLVVTEKRNKNSWAFVLYLY